MAFPGGHRDRADSGLKQAAMRETLEEVGLDLEREAYLGALDHHRAAPRGRRLDMLIAPHVFEIEGDPRFELNYEVDEAVWAPLEPLVLNEAHDTETLSLTGTPTVFNGYRLSGGHFVWGLTYRMLKDFFRTLDPGLVRGRPGVTLDRAQNVPKRPACRSVTGAPPRPGRQVPGPAPSAVAAQ